MLLMAERRGRMTEAQVTRLVGLLEQLPIRPDLSGTESSAVLSLGRCHATARAAYGKAYLALAERAGTAARNPRREAGHGQPQRRRLAPHRRSTWGRAR